MNRNAPTSEGDIHFDIVSSGYIRNRPEKRSYQDFVLSQGQAGPSQSSSSSRYNPANIASSSIALANNFSNSNAHHAHQSSGLQNPISVSQFSELQHALNEQTLTQLQSLIPDSYCQNIRSQPPTSQPVLARREPSILSQGGPPGIPRPNAEAVLAPVKDYLRHMWDGTRDEMQNHLGKQKAQYEQLLAREKALGEQRLQQAVAALSKQRDEANQQLQRVTSLYQQTQSENHTLREDAEKYKVEIRGFIAEKKKMEKKNGSLRQENKELSEELKKKDARIAWLSQEWSTGRALRLKLLGDNRQLLHELKDIEEKSRTELRQEFEADLAEVLAKAQLLLPAKQSGPENLQPSIPLESQVGPSTSFNVSEDQDVKMALTTTTETQTTPTIT